MPTTTNFQPGQILTSGELNSAFAGTASAAEIAAAQTKLARTLDSDDYTTVQLAIAASVATGIHVQLPERAISLVLTGDLIIPGGVELRGRSGATVINITGNYSIRAGGNNVTMSGVTINGGRYGFHANGYNGHTLEGVAIAGTSSHSIYLNGNTHYLRDISVSNSGATSCVLDGTAGTEIHSMTVDNGANFGIWGINAANGCILNGIRCTTANGLELIGLRYDCYGFQIDNVRAEHCGDNGISITGHSNVLNNIVSRYNAYHGVCFYGLRNILGAHRCDNNGQINATTPGFGIYAGVSVTPAFGGAARENRIGAGSSNDTQNVPTQSYGYALKSNSYIQWAAGASITNANLIRAYGVNIYSTPAAGTAGTTAPTWTVDSNGNPVISSDGNLSWTFIGSTTSTISRFYQAWSSGQVMTGTDLYRVNANKLYVTTALGTCGTTAPVHTSGAVSDGLLTWTFVEEFPGNLDAFDNTVSGVGGHGNALGLFSDSTAGNKNNIDVPGLKRVGHPTRNLWASWVVGSGNPNGLDTDQPGSFKSRLDVSDPGIAFWTKQNGSNTNAGWLQINSNQVGTTAARPNYAASYGSGANGITYTNTTTGHLETFISPNWVNAGTGATE